MEQNQVVMIVLGVIVAVVLGYLVFRHMNSSDEYSSKRKSKPLYSENDEDQHKENSGVEDIDSGKTGDNDVVESFYSVGGSPVPTGVEEAPENVYLLDDGNNRKDSIMDNMCSKSCCSPQYPTPFNLRDDQEVCKNKDKYVKSNIFCNNPYQDSGCLCLTKNQAVSLTTRGGNASSFN